MRHFFLVIAAIVISLASLKFLPAPYVWISVWWFLVFLYATLSSRRSSIKAVWFNIGIIILALGLFEAYLWINTPTEYRFEIKSTKDSSWWKHDFLGNFSVNDYKVNVKHYYGKELIWNMVYTIDSQGLRLSPPDTGGDDLRSILFFGGSFMFGWGLNDSETLPYQVGLKSNGNYRTYNFGFNGGGPHNMLSALEHGNVKDIVQGKPIYAIYEAIFEHVGRVAGINKASRNPKYPKYILDENGNIVYQGRFDEFDTVPLEMIEELRKSKIFKKILKRHRAINSDDIDLFVGSIAKSRDLLEDLYPGIKFHLLFWYNAQFAQKKVQPKMDEMLSRLKAKKIAVHIIPDILRIDTREKQMDFKISRLDRHPNAKANEMIAEYLMKEILIE